MEVFLYICVMTDCIIIFHINLYKIAELNTPVLTMQSVNYIGSSGSQTSIYDFIDNKLKCVGNLILSMSRITFPKLLLNSSCNVEKTDNMRPASYFGMAKLYSV